MHIKNDIKADYLKENICSNPRFIPNRISVLRREKNKPENKLEPDLNEIQRFVKREI